MKNKFFKILLPVALFVILGLVFNSNSINALCKIENETLIIHNEIPGKLLEEYKTSYDDYKKQEKCANRFYGFITIIVL